KEVKHPYIIRKNYSVELKNGLIVSLVEKPQIIKNNLLGCGTYIFKPEIFDFIKITPLSLKSKRIELMDAIDLMAKRNKRVAPFMLKGEYININNIDDYNSANYMLRSVNFSKKTTSLIIPAYNEEGSIGYVVEDFKGRVDEILVVNNNSSDNTEKIALEKGARVLTVRRCPAKRHGSGFRRYINPDRGGRVFFCPGPGQDHGIHEGCRYGIGHPDHKADDRAGSQHACPFKVG
ncbi:MAG: sugar phosphate nucleotidyltransferase, partial [Candidatus Omnitrophica bacterium]|nr:sugar phosphate nucleotidyltransferase [Candidatus Omnitrophota bacterium]